MQKTKMLIRHIAPVCVIMWTALISGFSQNLISFPDADLNNSDGLLFTAEIHAASDTWKNLYKTTLFADDNVSQAAGDNVSLLTCFPQKMDVLQGGNFLQIRNADGTFMYTAATETLEQYSANNILYPSPSSNARIHDNLITIGVSPDGNWMCYYQKKSVALASLLLSNTTTGEEIVLIETTEFSFQNMNILWSPDSSVLLYEDDGFLYFIDTKNAFSSPVIEQEFRKIGKGSINNTAWATDKMFVYIQDNTVFTVSVNELYTRALYSSVLGSGEVAGMLPWRFNDDGDRFWTDETGTQIVLLQGGHTLFYFDLGTVAKTTSTQNITTPFARILYSHAFLPIAGTVSNCTVFWDSYNTDSLTLISPNALPPVSTPIVWFEYSGAVNGTYAYRLQTSSAGAVYFEQLNLPAMAKNPSLSPDKRTLAFSGSKNIAGTVTSSENGLYLYDIASWQPRYTFFSENIISFAWKSNSALFVGGSKTVTLWDLTAQTSKVLFLSSVDEFGWDAGGTQVLASHGGKNFVYDEQKNTWQQTTTPIKHENTLSNSYWRIISSEGRNNLYENILFVRSLQGASLTKPLLREFLDSTHNRPTVSFAFDALDNQNGLVYILDTLSDYGLQATFFINGEFIKRFPDSVLSIVNAGHESAPMFYTTADLLSADFVTDENFIRRGLAYNEDEFFNLTGTDMELFWHTPYYRYSPVIEQAGNDAGYTLIATPLQFDDTLTLSSAIKQGIPYVSSASIIEDIIPQLFDGVIIPVSVGISGESRPDYLYEKLDVLINAIYEAGYDIAPISQILYQ